MFATAIGVQSALGPLAITFALVEGGDWGWLALAGIFTLAGLAARQVALAAADARAVSLGEGAGEAVWQADG